MIDAMPLGFAHRALDALAIWTEDRVRRTPEPCRLDSPEPLSCFGALPPAPETAPVAGPWSAPSPLPLHVGDRVSVVATPAAGERRGTALLVPPWKIRRAGLVGGYTRLLAASGLDVWLVCPPHHLDRAPPGARSGEAFVSLDVRRMRLVFEQSVLELRVLAALAARRGPVGIVGISLGALAGGLAATAPEPLDFAALIAPPDLGLVLAETGIGRRYRGLALAAGSAWPDADALAAALAPFDPALRSPTARRQFVAGALHDGVAPLAGVRRLASAWGVAPALYPRGHLSLIFLCRALRRDLARFAGEEPVTSASSRPG
jgi:hypothetical protein